MNGYRPDLPPITDVVGLLQSATAEQVGSRIDKLQAELEALKPLYRSLKAKETYLKQQQQEGEEN